METWRFYLLLPTGNMNLFLRDKRFSDSYNYVCKFGFAIPPILHDMDVGVVLPTLQLCFPLESPVCT